MRSYEDSKAKCFVELLLQTSKSRGVGGQLCLGKNVRHGGTKITRGGHLFLGTNVRGDTFSRGTAMPPTPLLYCSIAKTARRAMFGRATSTVA